MKLTKPSQRRSRLAILAAASALVVAAVLPAGCNREMAPEWGSTPTMTRQERFAEISRNWGLELQMMNDDIDYALLLRPQSGLTEWNVP